MALPLIFFAVLLWVGREELGFKGILSCLAITAVLLLGCVLMDASPYVFIALQALVDIILILILFGGDIRIR